MSSESAFLWCLILVFGLLISWYAIVAWRRLSRSAAAEETGDGPLGSILSRPEIGLFIAYDHLIYARQQAAEALQCAGRSFIAVDPSALDDRWNTDIEERLAALLARSIKVIFVVQREPFQQAARHKKNQSILRLAENPDFDLRVVEQNPGMTAYLADDGVTATYYHPESEQSCVVTKGVNPEITNRIRKAQEAVNSALRAAKDPEAGWISALSGN